MQIHSQCDAQGIVLQNTRTCKTYIHVNPQQSNETNVHLYFMLALFFYLYKEKNITCISVLFNYQTMIF